MLNAVMLDPDHDDISKIYDAYIRAEALNARVDPNDKKDKPEPDQG